MNRKKIGLILLLSLVLSFVFFDERGFADAPSGALGGSAVSRKVKEMKARYIKEGVRDSEGFILVGTPLNLADFEVTLVYDDKTSEVVKQAELSNKCMLLDNKIPVEASAIFEAKIAYTGTDTVSSAKVVGKARFQTKNTRLKKITAKWTGNTKYHVGDKILPKEITVTGTFDVINRQGNETESIRSINIDEVKFDPDTIKLDGENQIKASHKGFEAVFSIRGYAPKGLKVEYSGSKSLVVGQEIDRKKIKVSQLFSSGELKKIDDFSMSSTIINTVGPNIITISYAGATEQLTITGIEKKPEKISARYEGSELTAGSQIDLSKIILNVTNNDKSTEVVTSGFTINPDRVKNVGQNSIIVEYRGLKDTLNIKAAEMMPGNLIASYNGGMIIQGGQIKRSEISVSAYFPDGTNKNVTDFELSAETMNTVGIQEVIITYKGARASIYVPVTARMVTSLSVTYKGAALVQYSSINRNEIVVTATFNDGTSENISDYTMANTVASNVGRNTFTIFYGGKTKDLVVEVLPRLILGRGTLKAEVRGDDYSTSLTAFIENQYVREGIQLEVETIEKREIGRAVRRVHKTGKYLAFELKVDDFQFDENKYMIVEATIPEGFNPAKVGIFYTPDRTRVMVQMTGGLVSSDLYRFYAYRSGTYVIMETEESDVGRQELREEGQRTPFLIASLPSKMKVKEKRGIKPFLLFAHVPNEEFTYESGDEDVLTVSKEGLITAKKVGEASITISSVVGGYSKTYDVKVVKNKK